METYLPPNRLLSVKAKYNLTSIYPTDEFIDGWLIAQMDLAGRKVASAKTKGKVKTSGIGEIIFYHPLFPEDEISCYAEVKRLGRTCLTLHVEAWVSGRSEEQELKVTEGDFSFEAIDDNYAPRVIPKG